MFLEINIPVVPNEIWLRVTHNQRQKTLKVASVLLFLHILKTKSWLEWGSSLLNSRMWPGILRDGNLVKQRSGGLVCHSCFYHILTSCVIINEQTYVNMESICFIKRLGKEKIPIHIPATYRLSVRGFVLVQAFFKSQALRLVSAFSFVFYLTCVQFLRNVFQSFFGGGTKQNNGETFYKTASLSFMTHDGNCCERISC